MIKLRDQTRHPLWRRPKHYMDLPPERCNDHVHWIELFYDLVHVVAIFVLGNYLSHHLNLHGFIIFAGLFIAMWMAWVDNIWFNSLYVSTDTYHRLGTTILITTVMISAASIDSIDAKGWTFFAMAFAINRFVIAWLYWRAKKIGDSSTSLPSEMARNYCIIGVLTAVSAWLPKPYSSVVFASAIAWHILWFILPKIGVMRHERNQPRLGHLAERFALMVLIVSGEGFFKLVMTLSDKGVYKVTPEIFVNYLIGAFAILAMCWLYYDMAGNAKPKDDSNLTIYTWTVAHMLLMLGAVMMGVAVVGEVKVGFWEPFPFKYAMLGCTGVIIFLLMLTAIQKLTEPRLADRFGLGWGRWFGISTAFLLIFVVSDVPAIVGNLIWGTALFSQILIPIVLSVREFEREGTW